MSLKIGDKGRFLTYEEALEYDPTWANMYKEVHDKYWRGKIWTVTSINKDVIRIQHNQEDVVCHKRCLVKLKGE